MERRSNNNGRYYLVKLYSDSLDIVFNDGLNVYKASIKNRDIDGFDDRKKDYGILPIITIETLYGATPISFDGLYSAPFNYDGVHLTIAHEVRVRKFAVKQIFPTFQDVINPSMEYHVRIAELLELPKYDIDKESSIDTIRSNMESCKTALPLNENDQAIEIIRLKSSNKKLKKKLKKLKTKHTECKKSIDQLVNLVGIII